MTDINEIKKQKLNPSLHRSTHEYEDLSARFRVRIRNYERQFSNIYTVRIAEARHRLEKKVASKWGKAVCRLMDLNNTNGENCAIIGTLFKYQELKPSILQEVSKQYQTVVPAARTHFVSNKDELILEDETQRVTLHGKLDVNSVVTGCVVGVYGKLLHNGIFIVEDYCWSETEPITKSPSNLLNDRFLMIVSGMELATFENFLLLQLLVDWVTGWFGISDDFVNVKELVHIIIAGNCIRGKPQLKPKYGVNTDNLEDIEAAKKLDYIVKQLIENVDVDIMPGEYDPTNHTLPQQPLHKCLFPRSTQFSTFRSVSNPHSCKIENRLILGTSGQPVEDIQRYSNLTESLDILEQTLNWSHIAPTAPDTLPCYPFDDCDPFIIKERPHIYFVGNRSKFETKLKEYDDGHNVRLICVPSFAETCSFVLINLKNLECQPIKIKIK